MKILILLGSALMLLSLPDFGQSIQVPIKTVVLSEGDSSAQIGAAVSARIGASTRYILQSSPAGAELWLDVDCFRADQMFPAADFVDTYFVCHSDVTYYPENMKPLRGEEPQAGQLSFGNVSAVAESIFENFVRGTTDAVLAASQQSTIKEIQSFCESHQEQCANKTHSAK